MSIKGIRDKGLGIKKGARGEGRGTRGEHAKPLAVSHGPLSAAHYLRRLHRDERGVISVLSVFAMLALAILLGMVMNSGIQVDGKIRMQNAADAAAYSGAMSLTRGMNTIAFTNHLLCEVFSLTSIMREGAEQNEKEYVPQILAAWKEVGTQLSKSKFEKFTALSSAVKAKTTSEQSVADAYLAWIEAVSESERPTFEKVLSDELIPKFQRVVLRTYPEVAQEAADAAAQLDGQPAHGRGTMHAALWRPDGDTVAYPMLPVVDPEADETYKDAARTQRNTWAKTYLNEWNASMMRFFDRYGGRMSQFGVLWRGFTCGQLNKLCSEYGDTNLPMQILSVSASRLSSRDYLDAYLTVVGVAYWDKPAAFAPNLLKNQVKSDSNKLVTYAQARIFVPAAHVIYYARTAGTTTQTDSLGLGGVPGNDSSSMTLGSETVTTAGGTVAVRQSVPTDWTLFNQHWVCQLVPATAAGLATILQTSPSSVSGSLPTVGLTSEEIHAISPH